ncbi:acrylyl-CoA reductase (NADPH) [Mesorhizobium soli]|uniref:MDR family oxidoreductase n=1 Tax=Pseudaminobacter soli (ex Li et al. 2025) TaxID=1295366 RepID=UPI002474DEB7|nr:MDR family oxidoreductase [Mesorhizobium soli]MDH6232312.1 acrylyl-CoA reductase (NADPH) [Mesorhizobium soli]
MSETFTALMLEDVDGKPKAGFREISMSDLPDRDVLVEVAYSSLNYKDGLAVSGKGRIARRLPMVAGIDIAGTVVESRSPAWKPGDRVVANGWGMSETEWGGYARFQRLKPEWLMRLPDAFTMQEAMAIGTAGYTAALCVDALENWGAIQPGKGEVLVTGAAGGVGSTAVSLLSSKGYTVVASTGRAETHDYLRGLGATSFIDRAELSGEVKPLQKERWSGAVDSVGSTTLANVLAQTAYGGAVAACGLAGGANLPGTVMPHILRSVGLIGVDSVFAPMAKREKAWRTLADHLDREKLAAMTEVHKMRDLPALADSILKGAVRGRVVIEIA